MKGLIVVINMRKLAAIDMVFLGPKFVVGEYVVGVFLSAALGIFILIRTHSIGSDVFGVYFLCLGLNYAPMLAHAIAIRTRDKAMTVIADELGDTRKAMAKYRRVSLLLLIPLAVPLLEFARSRLQRERSEVQ